MRGADGEAGVTLMELMVTMTLTAILSTVAMGMFLTSNKSTNASIDANISAASARAALDSWTSLLQFASIPGPATPSDNTYNPNQIGQAIAKLSPDSITFYSNLGNRSTSGPAASPGPATLIQLSFVPNQTAPCSTAVGFGCLVEQRYDASNTATPAATRILLKNVKAGASSAVAMCGATSANTDPSTRLITACDSTKPIDDANVVTTEHISSAGPSPEVPRSVVVAFTVTNTDSDGATHTQAFASAAALTGSITT